MTPRLELSGVEVAYGSQVILKGVSLRLLPGSIGCLLGPSGCGKTTLLRAIAGFEPVSGGAIHLDGARVSSLLATVPPEQRHVGVVFQDYALFPHLTTAENIAFGLGGVGASERRSRVNEMLTLVGLSGLESRYPHQLSGGQQQRVALARALAPSPRLLLIDEPFSNLDADMRERLSYEVRRILKATGITALLVTHDQHEAFVMADEIGVLSAGQLQQWADAETLYRRPANRFVAQFIGQGAVLKAKVGGAGDLLHTALGDVSLSEAANLPAAGRYVEILVRPDQILADRSDKPNATVVRRVFRGMDALYTMRLDDGQELPVVTSPDRHHARGDRLRLTLATRHPAIVAPDAT